MKAIGLILHVNTIARITARTNWPQPAGEIELLLLKNLWKLIVLRDLLLLTMLEGFRMRLLTNHQFYRLLQDRALNSTISDKRQTIIYDHATNTAI